MRIAVISERWESTVDEGMLVYLDRLASHLGGNHETLILHDRGSVPDGFESRRVPMGKGLTSPALEQALRGFDPELVMYCPTACATFPALVRHHRLQRICGVPAVLLSLQSRDYSWWERLLLPLVRPWRLVVLSSDAAKRYRRRGFSVLESRAGVDLERFQPVDTIARSESRRELGVPEGGKLALHVGHLAAYRNLERLESLARQPGWRVLMLASTATEEDQLMRRRLENAGVEVRREFIPSIETYYQAADLYVFPVVHASGAIEFPLSVLEAMACGLPVLSTRFGALPENFDGGRGLEYIDGDEDLGELADELMQSEVGTRDKIAAYGWDAVMQSLVDDLEEAMRP